MIENSVRIVDEKTDSVYAVVPSDALGNLGSNPSCVVFDEVLTQLNGESWNAMRTGMGTRLEPFLLVATTSGDDPSSFAKVEHDECVKIADDRSRAPHRFVYLRNLLGTPTRGTRPTGTTPTLPSATFSPSPPCAKKPSKPVRRLMSMRLYQLCVGTVVDEPGRLREQHARCPAWGGLDLASKLDLIAWRLIVPDCIDGHPGEVIDYDEWSGEPVRQRLEKWTGVPMYPAPQTCKAMTRGMTELMTLARSRA